MSALKQTPKSAVRSAFNKAAASYNDNAILQQEIASRLDGRLNAISPNAETVVDLGAGTGLLSTKLLKRYPNAQIISVDFAENALRNNPASFKVCADAEKLPLVADSADIVVSNLMMQWCFNLSPVLSQCARVLKNGGLLLFSTFGPDTLKELRKSWAVVDEEKHINSFADMHNIGDNILQHSLQNPVMEMEMMTLTYQKVTDLMLDLKAIGAQTLHSSKKSLTGKSQFQAMIENYEHYRSNGKLPATFEVIYGHAWKQNDRLSVQLDNN